MGEWRQLDPIFVEIRDYRKIAIRPIGLASPMGLFIFPLAFPMSFMLQYNNRYPHSNEIKRKEGYIMDAKDVVLDDKKYLKHILNGLKTVDIDSYFDIDDPLHTWMNEALYEDDDELSIMYEADQISQGVDEEDVFTSPGAEDRRRWCRQLFAVFLNMLSKRYTYDGAQCVIDEAMEAVDSIEFSNLDM